MKIGFVSLGCPKNLVDAEVMLGLAEQAGHDVTPVADEADVLVVNTCAFIDRAKEESVNTILEMAELKKQAPRPAARGDRLPRRALSRRIAAGDSGNRRRSRHRRSAEDSRGADRDRQPRTRPPAPSRWPSTSETQATGRLPEMPRNLASTFLNISTTPTRPADSPRRDITPI